MFRDNVSGAPMIDRNQVVRAALWIRQNTTIEQHDRDVGSLEFRNDTVIGLVACRSPFQRSKENAGYPFGDVLLAELPGLLVFRLGSGRDVAPEKCIFARLRSF